jgi:hypothetical protein
MRIEPLLRRLEAEQAALAKAALTSPQARDLFEYGRVVGVHAGLAQAITIILEMADEQDRKGQFL